MGKESKPRGERRDSTALTASEKRELQGLIDQVDEFILAGGAERGECVGGGLPTSSGAAGRTMLAMQKFRVDWFSMPRKALYDVASFLAERHWFVRPVVSLNLDLFGLGFRFRDAEARKNEDVTKYPFARVAKDLLREYLTTNNAVALWQKNGGPDDFPVVNVPDLRDCELLAGGSKLKMTFKRNGGLTADYAEKVGDEMFRAMKNGGSITIARDDERWRWRVFTDGKRSSGFNAPALTGILDDLDYIEAIKVGDWNGAWQRRKMILQSLKGYAITSGSNAGITRGHAKRSQLEAVAKWLRVFSGAATLSTNFDQEFKHLVFPSADHFSETLTRATWERLLLWAGFAGVLLFKSESQIAGVSPYLMLQLRAKVFGFREDWVPFLASIFNHEDFKGSASTDLTPMFGSSHLYSVKELADLVTLNATNATMAPQSIREDLLDLDNEREVTRMKAAHEDPLGYTPVFEPRQGIVSGMNDAGNPSAGGGDSRPGPGRESESAV